MKKRLSIIIAIALMITLIIGCDKKGDATPTGIENKSAGKNNVAVDTVFKDVSENEWFYGNVQYVYDNGIMNGTATDKFEPNSPLSRAMGVTILYRAAGKPHVDASAKNPFDDVKSNQWYTDAVLWAYDSGIVYGREVNIFATDENITRAEFATILLRYANHEKLELPNTKDGKFADDDKIPEFAKEAVDALHKANIVNGKNANNFDPSASVTRAETAAMIHRFMEKDSTPNTSATSSSTQKEPTPNPPATSQSTQKEPTPNPPATSQSTQKEPTPNPPATSSSTQKNPTPNPPATSQSTQKNPTPNPPATSSSTQKDPTPNPPDTSSSNGLEITLNNDNNTYSVVGIGSCTATDIVFPSTYNGKPVTRIGDSAFLQNNNLTSVVIPNSVTSIGEQAFLGCFNLTSVVIPNSVTSIGGIAFGGCSKLANISIPNSVTSIGLEAFVSCKMESIEIPNGVKSIEDRTFGGCTVLKSIVIPSSVKNIGEEAFQFCRSLTRIEFKGTKSEWNAISKGLDWNADLKNCTIYCSDGEIKN